MDIMCFLETDRLPSDETLARKIALQVPLFTLTDGALYYVNPKQYEGRIAVPQHLKAEIMEENHRGPTESPLLWKQVVSCAFMTLVVGRNVC